MTGYVFEPQVDEEEWLDLSTHNFWRVWCSMPYPEGLGVPDRKKFLLVAHLLRQIADQLTDPVFVSAIEAGEQYADGLINSEEMWEAYERALVVYDTTPRPHQAAADAVDAAQRYLYDQGETAEMVVGAAGSRAAHLAGGRGERAKAARRNAMDAMEALIRRLIHEVHGNPFRPVTFAPEWRTGAVVALARQMYDTRDFAVMPILGDALEEAGCTEAAILEHVCGPGPHIRGCWVVDLVLGK